MLNGSNISQNGNRKSMLQYYSQQIVHVLFALLSSYDAIKIAPLYFLQSIVLLFAVCRLLQSRSAQSTMTASLFLRSASAKFCLMVNPKIAIILYSCQRQNSLLHNIAVVGFLPRLRDRQHLSCFCHVVVVDRISRVIINAPLREVFDRLRRQLCKSRKLYAIT